MKENSNDERITVRWVYIWCYCAAEWGQIILFLFMACTCTQIIIIMIMKKVWPSPINQHKNKKKNKKFKQNFIYIFLPIWDKTNNKKKWKIENKRKKNK